MEISTATPPLTREKDPLTLAAKIGPTLSQYITEEESNGRLSQPVVNALREAGFYKLYLPKSLGGWEADPLTTARIVEEIARHNTAAGWSLMVANTTLFPGSMMPEKGIEEIFGSREDVFVAGSIHPPMLASPTTGGFRVNGRNALISNVHEADWIMATAFIMENGQPKMHDGIPEIICIYMRAKDCLVHDTWQTFGMCATDSNDVEAKDVFVPDHLSFPLIPLVNPGKHFGGPLYRMPAAAANIACLLTPVSLAVAANAIQELKNIAGKKTPLGSMVPLKERGVVQRKLGRAEALVRSARAYLHDSLEKCWDKVREGESISLEEKAGLLLAAAHANQSCVEAVELVYTAAGTHGIYSRNKLSHYFTNAQVLRQHGFMNESRYETAGQVFLGLPPDLPIIQF